MEQLIEKMKVLLASSFAFYLKAQFFHWNVTGPTFAQDHEFFGGIYEDVHGSIDRTAEEIRALGSFAPGSFQRYSELSLIGEQINVPTAAAMYDMLRTDNDIMLALLTECRGMADAAGVNGLVNYLEDRLDTHMKHGWMLRAYNAGTA